MLYKVYESLEGRHMNYYESLNRRITALEKALRVTNEAIDYSDKQKAFTDICNSCNLTNRVNCNAT